MAEANPPQVVLPQGYQVGTTVVMPLPAEQAYPLKRLDFLTLCDGSNGDERAGRDLHVGLFVSAVVGIAGLLSCADLASAFAQRKSTMLGCFAALVIIAGASAWGCLLHWRRMWKEDTPYTRLKDAIMEFFNGGPLPERSRFWGFLSKLKRETTSG